MYRFLIAVRYLRSRPILWVSVLGVLLGIASIVVVDSILNGFLSEQRRIFQGARADLSVQLQRYATPDGLVTRSEEVRERVLQTEGVASAAHRLVRWCLFPSDRKVPTLLSLGELSRGPVLQVLGIIPREEQSVSGVLEFLVDVPEERRVADPSAPFEVAAGRGQWPILLGDRLAEFLELRRGDEIELLTLPETAPTEDGIQPVAGRFVLAGTFRTGAYNIDLTTAYMRLPDLQQYARVASDAAELAVRVEPGEDRAEVRDRLRAALQDLNVRPSHVLTWEDTEEILLGAVENQRVLLNVILFSIIFVAGFNLLTTLNLTITDKIQDIGTLSSLGASSVGISSIFTGLGFLVSLLGSVLGLVLGVSLAMNINGVHDAITRVLGNPIFTEDVYGLREIPSQLDPVRIALCVVLSLLCTILFTSLASWRVARLDPVEALRRE